MNRRILTLFLCLAIAFPPSAAKRQNDGYVLKVRGVMESFPDIEEGLDDRLQTYSHVGMTHYFYCPSDDRYSNAWGWKFLYNDNERHALKSLRTKCLKKGLEFVWTVSPGESYRGDQKDYEFLLNKLVMMYYGGMRSLAVKLPGKNLVYDDLKVRLEADMSARIKGKSVSLYVMNEIPTVVFPSDGDPARTIMQGYHFDEEFKKATFHTGAVNCILKEKSELAKIALAAVVDCARDPERYDSDLSMANGVAMLSPQVKESFTRFLSHTGGIRESENIETFPLARWSRGRTRDLLYEFERIERVPSEMEKCQSPALLESLRPWLTEFGHLGTRGRRTIECLNHYINGDVGSFWLTYIDNQMSDEDRKSYERHPVGEMKLQPFYENMMEELTDAFTLKLTGGTPLKNLASTLYAAPNAALDSDLTTSIPSDGHIEFPIPAEANACRLLTGPLKEDAMVLFRQIGTDGDLVAEFIVESSYSEFDLKEGAVKVDVLGDVDIYESIFVYL